MECALHLRQNVGRNAFHVMVCVGVFRGLSGCATLCLTATRNLAAETDFFAGLFIGLEMKGHERDFLGVGLFHLRPVDPAGFRKRVQRFARR